MIKPALVTKRFEHGSYLVTVETDGEGKFANILPYRLTYRNKTNSFSCMMSHGDIHELWDMLEMLRNAGVFI